jgi:hypothetical protein
MRASGAHSAVGMNYNVPARPPSQGSCPAFHPGATRHHGAGVSIAGNGNVIPFEAHSTSPRFYPYQPPCPTEPHSTRITALMLSREAQVRGLLRQEVEHVYGSILPQRLKRRKLDRRVSRIPEDDPHSLGSPQFHHLCVAAYGVRWRLTGTSDFQKPLGFGPWRPMAVNRRFRDRSENHGVPGSNPGPAT